MADTLFADVSYFQADVNDRYPYKFFSFRSNDGTFRDPHFSHNLAWSKHACDTGKLEGFIVYFVFETNWRETFETFVEMVGKPHPKMAIMIDVESWGGKIRGNHSGELNALRAALVKYLKKYRTKGQVLTDLVTGNTAKRVFAYGNAGDLRNLWPRRGTVKVVLAAYGSNPSFPNKIAHQFSDRYPCPPFGHCDMNSADGRTPAQFAKQIGLDASPSTKSVPKPKPPIKPKPVKRPAKPRPHAPKHAAPARHPLYVVRKGDTMSGIAERMHVSLNDLIKANPHAGHPAGHYSMIQPGDRLVHP